MIRNTQHITSTILILAGLLLCCFKSHAANEPKVMVMDYMACVDTELSLSVEVENFNDIQSFTFFIEVDTSQLEFVNLNTENPALQSGTLVSNFTYGNPSALNVNWVGNSPVNLNGEILFNLNVRLKDTIGIVDFNQECEIVFSDLSIAENAIYENGRVLSPAAIYPAPEIQEVTVGSQASFEIPAVSNASYQWMVWKSGSWININNNQLYEGAFTHNLIIRSVDLAMDSFKYRCHLSNPVCAGNTGEAQLVVNTTGLADPALNDGKNKLHVYPNPAGEKIWISCHEEFDCAVIKVYDISGRLKLQHTIGKLNRHKTHMLHLDELDEGIYVLQLRDKKQLKASRALIIK